MKTMYRSQPTYPAISNRRLQSPQWTSALDCYRIEPKGSKASQAERVIRKIEEWTADLNIPQNLKTFGVSKEDVPSLAEAAADVKRLMDNNPKPMSIAEIEAVYLKLLDM